MVADLIRHRRHTSLTSGSLAETKDKCVGLIVFSKPIVRPPYVPDGPSLWEFGVADGALAKANGDYDKRTREVEKERRKETTFVFVSPRT